MNKLIFIPFLLVLIASCSKDEPLSIDTSVSTEINHYDWNPDTLIFDSLLIDLNNDNIDDLKFLIEKIYQGTSPSGGPYYNYFAKCISVNPELKISLGVEMNPSQQEWDCLEFEDSISTNLTWKNSFTLNGEVIIAGSIGIWDMNNSYGYIGLKFESTQATYFGWININSNYNPLLDKRYEITCFEYAVSETSNFIIKAGQIE